MHHAVKTWCIVSMGGKFAIRKDLESQGSKSFFAHFSVFDVDGTIPIQTVLDRSFRSANRRQGNLAAAAVSAPSARMTA